SSGPRRFFRYTMFLYSCYLCYFMSLYPFTERYAQPYFFSCFDTAEGRYSRRHHFCRPSSRHHTPSTTANNHHPITLTNTTATTTAVTTAAFPAAAAAVVGLWVADRPPPPRVDWVMIMSNSGCSPPNHHCGGGRTMVQPPQPHLVVSGCDGATTSEASRRSAAKNHHCGGGQTHFNHHSHTLWCQASAPQSGIPLRCCDFGGVTDWYQSTGYRELAPSSPHHPTVHTTRLHPRRRHQPPLTAVPLPPAPPFLSAISRHHTTSTTANNHHPITRTNTTATTTAATVAAFPAAAANVVGLWVADWPPPPRVDWVMIMSNSGCPPPNHHRGGGRTTVQPHLVVSGCDGATTSEASGRSAAKNHRCGGGRTYFNHHSRTLWCRASGGDYAYACLDGSMAWISKDYPIWKVIQNDNGPFSIIIDTNGMIKVLPPKTAEEVMARERERKAKNTLLMALPEDHLAKFHKIADSNEMWEATKSILGGNDESKKMQKYLLKQQFEGFYVSASEGLHKGYDRFQTLLSQLEIYGAGVSHEDANQKFLRSLPSSWSQVALIMRNKPGLDTLSFDDLYNNLRVFERDVKGTTASSSFNMQNMAFVSTDNTRSTNDVSTAYSVSSPYVSKSQKEGYASYTDEINDDDLEEIDLKWQVAMISMRIKKFHKRTGRKLQFDTRDTVGFDKTKINSGSDNEVESFSKTCEESYARLKKLYNEQRDKLGDASVEIIAYTLALKKSVFMNKECDLENTPVNDRYAEGMHTVPSPVTGNYMPSEPDVETYCSKFTSSYFDSSVEHNSADKSDSKPVEFAFSYFDSSVEPSTFVPEPIVNESKVAEYDIWAMKMEHYLCHTDYPIWKVIQNGNGPVSVIIDTKGMIKVLPPKTAEEVVASEREKTARTTLLMVLLEDHLVKLHKMADAKEMSLPSSWSQVALIMRTKLGLDTLSFDDLYNNLRVFERDVKGTTTSSSFNTQNVAFVSIDNTSSTNDINDDDLDEMDLKWQVPMISMRIKKFYKRIGQFVRDYIAKWNQDSRRQNGGNSGSYNEVQSCSKTFAESYARLKKLYDEQRDKLGDASVEIIAYTLALKKSVFMNKECNIENTYVNDRYAEGMNTVPSPMTGNYMPSGPDVEINCSKFTYGPKHTSDDKSDFKLVEYASSDSVSGVEPSTFVHGPILNELKVVSEPKAVCEPKVWTDAPIIEEYESDTDDDLVFNDRHSHTRKSLGYARKSCFVCGSFSHLIRDCDFHEKRMAKQAELTKSKNKVTGQRENRQVWNNIQRVNQQNKFVPSVVLTKTGKFLVNAARQNYSSKAASTSTASKVNTARPFVNETRPKRCFYKTRSPNKRPFHNTTAQRTTFSYHKVNTVNTSLSVVKGNGDSVVKASAGVNTPRCNDDSIKLKELMVLCLKLSNTVLALEQSKTARDLVIKKLQKNVKRIERKIKARTLGMTLFKIGNFRRKSLDKENVSKQERYLKTRPMFEESDFDNIDDMMFLLVEKKYPLRHFTLQQMLDNVRLEVEEESEMSLELLRHKRKGCKGVRKGTLELFMRRYVPSKNRWIRRGGVICEDMLKGAYFEAKTMIFEDCIFLTNTPYPQKEIRRIRANSSQGNAYKQFPIRRITHLPYAVSSWITIQRFGE
nr:ribonuclease H-like domain-containing protein [Tanacetum cinerariifolium]